MAVSCCWDASLEQDLEGMWRYEMCKIEENPAGKPQDSYDLKWYVAERSIQFWKKNGETLQLPVKPILINASLKLRSSTWFWFDGDEYLCK